MCQVSDCLAGLDKVDLQVVYFCSYNHPEMFGDGNFSEPSHIMCDRRAILALKDPFTLATLVLL